MPSCRPIGICFMVGFFKSFLSFFLVMILAWHQFTAVFILIDYELNKDWVTLKYCENKDKPEMNCQGKCHLIKQLQKNKNQDDKIPPRFSRNNLEYFFLYLPADQKGLEFYKLIQHHTLPRIFYSAVFSQVTLPPPR